MLNTIALYPFLILFYFKFIFITLLKTHTHTHTQKLLDQAQSLMRGHFQREMDAGAQIFRIILRKYCLKGVRSPWLIQMTDSTPVVSRSSDDTQDPIVYFVQHCLSILSRGIDHMESVHQALIHDPTQLQSMELGIPVQGILLVIRYALGEVVWSDIDASADQWRAVLSEMLRLKTRILESVAYVIAGERLPIPADHFTPNSLLPTPPSSSTGTAVVDCRGHVILDSDHADTTTEQLAVVNSWLATKEVGLSLGALISSVGLPLVSGLQSECAESQDTSQEKESESIEPLRSKRKPAVALLSIEQIELTGDAILNILLQLKHKGAIAKTQLGFQQICDRLLQV